MKRKLCIALAGVLLLSGCAPKHYNTIVSPKKSAEEKVAATAHAQRIFTVYHGQGLAHARKELAKPEVQQQLTETVTDKLDNSSLGECLTKHGFGTYITQRMMKDVTGDKLRSEIIDQWVEQYPLDMLKKVDQTFSTPSFKKIFHRLREMPGGNIRAKLKDMRAQNIITEAEANEFILNSEDRDVKSFMIISQSDVKRASRSLLEPYFKNPSSVVLDFMKNNPAANNQCSFLEGGSV